MAKTEQPRSHPARIFGKPSGQVFPVRYIPDNPVPKSDQDRFHSAIRDPEQDLFTITPGLIIHLNTIDVCYTRILYSFYRVRVYHLRKSQQFQCPVPNPDHIRFR